MDPASQAALVFLFVTMQIIIMTQTTVVFILIICRKSLRTIPNLYIASLSVSDFLVGAFFATSAIIAALEVDMSGGWCRFIISMELLSYTAGSISLLALSIDRYRAVCKARGYKPSAKSTVTVMGIVWIISFLYCLRNLVRFETNDNRRAGVLSPIWCNTFLGEQTLDLHFRAVDFFLVFLIPGIAMSVLYTKVYIQLKKSFAIAPTSFVTRKKRATKMLIIQWSLFSQNRNTAITEDHHTDNHHTDNHHTDNHHTDNTDNHHTDNHHTDNHHTDNHHIDNHHIDNHHTDNHHTDSHHTDNHHIDKKSS
ncbi:hypothetical protein FSP39_011939 [Pinctada imbricata]|uniref:G-protein coupled receptors family 1 profile domain-containing protein n=1 Tax=Pinctada imbricata TaxID=66713 RepID=A0AA88YIX2_PINIB|nr:hypothetical protein FSP39_011939 [Pinctada imbricata]